MLSFAGLTTAWRTRPGLVPSLVLVVLTTALTTGLTTDSSANESYVITLNATDNATVFCFSDYLTNLKLETEECLECKRSVERDPDCGKGAPGGDQCRCRYECEDRARKCPKTPAEHSICLPKIRSRANTDRKLICTARTATGGTLVINITVVQHNSSNLCYGETSGVALNESDLVRTGAKFLDPANETLWTPGVLGGMMRVQYNSPILCVNTSSVATLDAGHLVGVGYTLGSKTFRSWHERDHSEGRPSFERFCKVDQPRLWKHKEGFRSGAIYQCNGTFHVLDDEFPCLQFPPSGPGFKLPSLENCSTGQMVGIVLAMIVAMVMCYTVLIACVKVWTVICTCGHKELVEMPLTHADSSNSRLNLVTSVVKQESSGSLGSGGGVIPPPAPLPGGPRQPPPPPVPRAPRHHESSSSPRARPQTNGGSGREKHVT